MKLTAILFTVGLVVFPGCSLVTSAGDDTTGFFSSLEQVAPSFVPESSSTVKLGDPLFDIAAGEWSSGTTLYEVYYIFREFNPDTDQGVIDTSNLYKTIYESSNFFSNTMGNCSEITEQVIEPPFDFGNNARTYNCAFNQEASDGYDFGGACKKVDSNGDIMPPGDVTGEAEDYGAFGFVWNDGTHAEYGSQEAYIDNETGNLSFDIAVWVDYSDENDYCYRNDIDGNSGTHAFTLRAVKGNKVESSYYISIVGKGYSEGAGEYFLLKVFTPTYPDGRYYCIGADDGEAELIAMNDTYPAGLDTAVGTNCEEYQADVDAMTQFTTNDLACESGDFNPGGTGTAVEGTVFLNYTE